MNERGDGAESDEQADLVFALCHEIGNLLAASRMQASLIEPKSDVDDIQHAADTISTLSGRIGSLVSLMRPILSRPSAAPASVDPLDLLDGLQGSLDDCCEERVRFNLKSAVDLPRANIDADPLHHLLMMAIYEGLEDSAPNGEVGVSVRAEGGVLTFAIEVTGPARERGLSQRVAGALLRVRGGEMDVAHANGTNRVEMSVPAVPA